MHLQSAHTVYNSTGKLPYYYELCGPLWRFTYLWIMEILNGMDSYWPTGITLSNLENINYTMKEEHFKAIKIIKNQRDNFLEASWGSNQRTTQKIPQNIWAYGFLTRPLDDHKRHSFFPIKTKLFINVNTKIL